MVKPVYQQITLSPKLGVVKISTLWHFRLPLPIQMFIKVASSPRLSGIEMDGRVRILRPFNSISVISRRWKGEHERLCAMKRRLGSGRISPPAGFEPATRGIEMPSPIL